MAKNVSQIARGAQWTAEDAGATAEAMKTALNPMLRAIEVQSGMVPDANVLQNRLFTDSGSGSLGAYYSALASKLPEYVNARRAYEAEQKKKAAAASGGGQGGAAFQLPNYQLPLTNLPPPQYYLPMTSLDVPTKTGGTYATSPYGAIPMRVVTATQPAARTLAERKYSRTGKVAM